MINTKTTKNNESPSEGDTRYARTHKKINRLLGLTLNWLKASPVLLPDAKRHGAQRFYETGDKLVKTVEASIARGQHVVLYGPRGCGKSYTIAAAIRMAEERGTIAAGAWTKVQGNKEFSRDALIEDEITLTLESENQQVVPHRKSAPLFVSVERDSLGQPKSNSNVSGGLNKLEMSYKHSGPFVLFLDEINRFSDGVLDSLLLLLEEGQVVMGGKLYQLPIVVCMTMNPPGYDASARVLSPPLAARIGQSFRLRSPSLNVLSDIILPERVDKSLETDWLLLRRAALVTLCCWGSMESKKPGLEYLSSETQRLINAASAKNRKLRNNLITLSQLCHFGPDGRALGDWYSAAWAEAKREAEELGFETCKVTAVHFVDVAIRTLGHKIQDAFSQAANPNKLAQKEQSLRQITYEILMHPETYNELIERELDNLDNKSPLAKFNSLFSTDLSYQQLSKLRMAFITTGITDNEDFRRWQTAMESVENKNTNLLNTLISARIIEKHNDNYWFRSQGDKSFFKWLKREYRSNVDVWDELENKVTGARSEPFDLYLKGLSIFIEEKLTLIEFHKFAAKYTKGDPIQTRAIADELNTLWLYAEFQGSELIPEISERLKIAGFKNPSKIIEQASELIKELRNGRGIRQLLKALKKSNR